MTGITPERPKLHSLADVAPILCDDTLADPQRWLTRQILSGRIRARKIGRQWRMTDADIAYALEVFANIPGDTTPEATDHPAAIEPDISPPPAEPSARSSRRRRLAAAT